MLFKLSNLNSNLGLTLGYLNLALNNSALYLLCEGTYYSASSTQYIWELITINICLCAPTFGSCWLGTSRRSAGKQMTHSDTNIGTAGAGQVVVD